MRGRPKKTAYQAKFHAKLDIPEDDVGLSAYVDPEEVVLRTGVRRPEPAPVRTQFSPEEIAQMQAMYKPPRRAS